MTITGLNEIERREEEEMVVTITLDVAALNTDILHWFLSSIKTWNEKMPESKMECTAFEAEGMNRPILTPDDIQAFWEEWEKKLPYDWGG